MNNEMEFREYLKNVNSQLDTQFDENTIDNFILTLKMIIPNEIDGITNILILDDIDLLKKIKQRLSKSGDLYDFNRGYKTGRPSQAMFRYIDFLNKRDNLSQNNDSNIDYKGFKDYLENLGYAEKTIRNNLAYIKRTLKILEQIDWFHGTDNQKILKFAVQDNSFKEEFDKYHDYNPENDSTFTNFRESAKKYKTYLTLKNTTGIQYDKTEKDNNINTKNIMLYGAPGVGKTHNYKKLISMIEEGADENTIFDAISKNEDTQDFDYLKFNEAKKDTRIEFVTFHQSYSYEDFLEGYRPNEDGKIELEKYGIFKKICKDAQENLDNSKKKIKQLEEEKSLYESFKEYASNRIENNIELKLKKGAKFYLSKFENDILFFKTSEESNVNEELSLSYRDFVSINTSLALKETLKDISNILGTNSIQQKYAYYLQIYYDFKNYENKSHILNENITEKEEQKNFYIIIDEINRGNISKIFGELITLIEEDKRGKKEYEVTLPYSKDKFLIPENLYIIATMNSTDKSIATIDIALRRRFTFLKMKPNPELVIDKEAKQLMVELNQYISKSSLGEDFQLGHSYFMGKDINLDFIIEYKIKPLLQEYFYSDEKSPDEIISLAKKEYKIEEENKIDEQNI